MLRVAGGFARSRGGSMMPLFFLSLVPLITVVGFSVDYTDAVETRSNMQEALDAATLSITTLPSTTSLSARQQALQDNFTANNGEGTTTLASFNIAADGTVTAQTSASFAMPTDFMSIARIATVPVGVSAAVNKAPALVQATFKIDQASGWWNKTIYLYGTQFGSTTANKLMRIDYVYNGYGDPKGYGTTTAYTVAGTKLTQVQQQVCTTTTVTSFSNAPAGSIQQTSSNGTKYLTTCATTPVNGTGAVVDVSQMGGLALEMDVPSGSPTVLRTDNTATSDRLYYGQSVSTATEVPANQLVDIFSIVPCGQTSWQAWEDGGSPTPGTAAAADFSYTVTGKCAFDQRPSQTALTQ